MFKKLILIGVLIIHWQIIYAEVFIQTLQGDFQSGEMENITLSKIPGGGYINIANASIKLAGKYPIWYRDSWQVPDVDFYPCPHLMDFDGDGDFDILIGQRTKGGKIHIVENIGSKWQPEWKIKEIWEFNLSDSDVITVPYHADLNGDGDFDLLIGVAIENIIDVWAYENIGSPISYHWVRKPEWDPPDRPDYNNMFFAVQPSLVDIDDDGDNDLFLSPISVDDWFISFIPMAYENIGGTSSPNWIRREAWDLKKAYHSYLNFWDLDGDDDYDIFAGRGEANITAIENIGSSISPNWNYFSIANYWTLHDLNYGSDLRFENPSVTIDDLDNNGDIDLIVGNQESGYCLSYENLGFLNGKLIWKQRSPWDTSFVDQDCSVAIADLTFDGKYDVMLGETVGSGHGMGYVYENIGERPDALSIWSHRSDLKLKLLTTLNNGQGIFNSKPVFVDIDNDYDYDILVGDSLGKMYGVENIKTIYEPEWGLKSEWDLPSPLNGYLDASPTVADLDNDGDYDLLVGYVTPGNKGIIIGYKNSGSNTSPKFEINPKWQISLIGSYPSPCLVDIDGDNDYDLLVATTAGWTWYENIGSPTNPIWKLRDNIETPFIKAGGMNPVFCDLDNDGDYDLLIGDRISDMARSFTNIGPHYPSGTFTSTILGSSTAILNWHKIFWSEKKPTNTSIKMQIRVGDTQIPGNTWSDWTYVTNGSKIAISSKYIQYRAIFETTELEKSPVLYEVRITYKTKQNKINIYPPSGPVGSIITIEGEGFGADERIQIDFGVTLGIIFASTSQLGTFTSIFTVDNQPQGVTSVTAIGLNSNLTATDYFIITSYSYIKGYIRGRDNLPIRDVGVILSGDKFTTYTTKIDGYYEFIELLEGTYTVTPVLSDYAFIPASRTYQPLTSNADNQDFIGITGMLSIYPKAGTIGSVVKIEGNDFLSTELVIVKFGDITIGTFSTDAYGSFTNNFTIPIVSEGTTTVTAIGLSSQLTSIDYFYVKFELSRFKIDLITTPQTAGLQFTITITAIDNTGGILTNFNWPVALKDLSNTVLPKTITNFISGVCEGTVSITKVGTTSIIVSCGDKFGTSNQFYIKAGTPTKFLVYPKEAIDISAGESADIIAQLVDAYDNFVSLAGITCNLEIVVLDGKQGILSTTTVTTNELGEIGTITYQPSIHAGDKVKILLQPTISNLSSTISGTITTCPASLDHFVFDTIATQTAGINFKVKITAKDIYENTTPFDGVVLLSDKTDSLNPKQTASFTNGIWQGFGSITTAGNTNIIVIYNEIVNISNEFVVKGAELDHLVISTITTQIAGLDFQIIITAKDRFGNVADGFNGMVDLSDVSNTILPTFTTNFISGVWYGTVAITKSGTTTITATYQDKSNTSDPFFITSGTVDNFVLATITNQIAGMNFGITIEARDKYGNPVISFTDKVLLTDISQSITPTNSGNFKDGVWNGDVKITKVGTTTIVVNYQDKKGTSNTFFIHPGSLDHFRFATIVDQIAGERFNIIIIACDTYGNTVTTYSKDNTIIDTTGSIIPTTTPRFINGILKDFPVTIFIARDGVQITTSGDGKDGMSNPFNISPGVLDHFKIDEIPSPQKAGNTFYITISAMDKNGNVVTTWKGKVSLNDTSQTLIPLETTELTDGIWQGNVCISKAGTTAILVKSDKIYGISNVFKVIPGDLARIVISPQEVELAVDESQIFIATGIDRFGNEVEGLEIKSWELEVQDIGKLTEIGSNSVKFVVGTNIGINILKAIIDNLIATANITILPGKLAYVVIEPSIMIVEVGGSCTFTAYGMDKYGNKKDEKLGMWNIDYEIGRLVNTFGNKTTFIAKTIPQQGTITYKVGDIVGNAKIVIKHDKMVNFKFDIIPHAVINTPFKINIKAIDRYGNLVEDYNNRTLLTTTYGNLIPLKADFKEGIFEGTVTINANIARPNVQIIVRDKDKEDISLSFALLYDQEKKVTVKEMEIELEIGENNLDKDYYLEIDKPSLDEQEIKIANLRLQTDPAFKQLNDTIIRIIPKDGDGNKLTTDINANSTTLVIHYQELENNIANETLKLYMLDNSGLETKWVEVEDSNVLLKSNVVHANIPRLGTFVLIGRIIPKNFDNFIVYPNPFKPIRGDEYIYFEGLPKDSHIRIYDISGCLIKEEKYKNAIWKWDVKSKGGKMVDSGIYIYIITVEEGFKTKGKIAVIR